MIQISILQMQSIKAHLLLRFVQLHFQSGSDKPATSEGSLAIAPSNPEEIEMMLQGLVVSHTHHKSLQLQELFKAVLGVLAAHA